MYKNNNSVILFFLLVFSSAVMATENNEDSCIYKGNYVFPANDNAGYASSLEIGLNPPEEQLGKIRLKLVNEDWSGFSEDEKESICRKLDIKRGIFRGRVTTFIEPFVGVFLPLIDHAFSNGRLDSTLYTKDDVLDPFTIVPVNECIITAIEQINVERGNNRFGNGLIGSATGSLFVTAQLNFCTGQNKFEFIAEHNGIPSSICFDEDYCQ